MSFETPLRILLVEDDDEDALILMNSMRSTHQVAWQVTRVVLLEHALRELRSRPFDVVLLDLSLPDSRGHETIMTIEQRAPLTAVVVLTGLDDDSMVGEAIRQGAQDYLVKGQCDARLIARSLRYAIERKKSHARLLELALQLEQANNKLRELITIDPLTNVHNRRHFEDALNQSWSKCARHEHSITLLLVDVDHLKKYNDAKGYLEGDSGLQKIASVLRSGVRRVDDLVARYGGEEFVILLPNTSKQTARTIADRLLHGVQDLNLEHSGAIAGKITISIGIACLKATPDGDSAALLNQADHALFLAKSNGRNCVVEAPDA